MNGHHLARTTHTLELRQLQELNSRLAATGGVSPETLAIPSAAAYSGVLCRTRAEGPPSYPYVYGVLRAGAGDERSVPLHTPALRELSRRLGLPNHRWGC